MRWGLDQGALNVYMPSKYCSSFGNHQVDLEIGSSV